MKQRLRYSWQNHRWDGRLLSARESVHLSSLGLSDREQFIASIVASLRSKEDVKQRRTARFRVQCA